MVNFFIFLGVMFLLIFLLGRLFERIKIPWIFAALFLGVVLSAWNPFSEVTSSETFAFLAELGMFFLLFIIGFEIDLKKMREKSGFLFKSTFFIIFLEAFFGSILLNLFFGLDWLVCSIVALSFATVGEAVLVPILDEFGIMNKPLGQTIIDIGLLDDIIEISLLLLIVVFIGTGTQSHINILIVLLSLFALFFMTGLFMRLEKEGEKFRFLKIETIFLLVLFVFFFFLGIGELAQVAPLAAMLAGISMRTFIPEKRIALIESEIKTMCYGFFAPIFFLHVGETINLGYIAAFPLLVLAVIAVSSGSKLLGSWIMTRKTLGSKQSILLGLGLSVRFSTSIVIIKILLDNGIIGLDLYSVILASSIVFTFALPIIFSRLLIAWNIPQKKPAI